MCCFSTPFFAIARSLFQSKRRQFALVVQSSQHKHRAQLFSLFFFHSSQRSKSSSTHRKYSLLVALTSLEKKAKCSRDDSQNDLICTTGLFPLRLTIRRRIDVIITIKKRKNKNWRVNFHCTWSRLFFWPQHQRSTVVSLSVAIRCIWKTGLLQDERKHFVISVNAFHTRL